ncbi:RHS repeat-associated core domain-containing protein, partial [Leptospira interrogans]
LNGVRIAALNEAGALAYYLTDQVDSVSTVLDDEGNTLSLMQYLPYGDTFVQRGDLNFSPKFNSQELDRESGFYFFNARFYDPGIARFTSADTLIPDEYNSQAWNRFAYVYNNPIGAKDPTGHAPQDENAGFKDASKNIANGFVEGVKTTLSAPTPVNAVVNSAVATGKGAKELYDNRKEVYASAKDFAGKLTSKDDKVRDYAAGQAKAYTMSAVLGGAASKALGSRLSKPNVDVPGGGGNSKLSSLYENTTGARSRYPNRKTDVSKSEFETNLKNSGWKSTPSKDGLSNNYSKGDSRYSVRDDAKSTKSPTAEYFKDSSTSKASLKIRLKE